MYKSEIKEMGYIPRDDQEVLYLEINDDDSAICIIDRGGYPCTYIKMPEDVYQNNVENGWDSQDYESIDVWVHGGVTFGKYDSLHIRVDPDNFRDDPKIPTGYWLGWDYCHCGDYHAIFGGYEFDRSYEHKYSIKELIDEAHEALNELKNNDWHVFVNNEEENND